MNTLLNIALPKGRLGERVYAMLAEAGFPCPSVLEDGRLVGLGTHEELLTGCPVYTEICHSQQPAEEVPNHG